MEEVVFPSDSEMERAASAERLRLKVQEIFAKRQGGDLAQSAETLENLSRSAEPVVDEPVVDEPVPPEPPAMRQLHEALRPNGYPKVEVRVSLQEKEAWMRHAYEQGMNLSEFVRETMNRIVASGGH